MEKSIGIIGCGNMGSMIVKGLRKKGFAGKIYASRKNIDALHDLLKTNQLSAVFTENKEVVRKSTIIIIAVPSETYIVSEVCKEIRAYTTGSNIESIISVAATIPISFLEGHLDGFSICRAMPNAAVESGKGITAIAGENIEARNAALLLFNVIGDVFTIKEEEFDAYTALSLSGIFYLIYEALIDAGVRIGLPYEKAKEIITASAISSARMIYPSEKHLSELKYESMTPAGITVEAIATLEKHGIRDAMFEAVKNAFEKMKS